MAKERNDGKRVEKIVALFENFFKEEGCVVTVNDKVYNEDGKQIAEFDIIVEKTSGENLFKWLIECRDRPKSGSAPASWIEQLIGRKARFGFDRISAVSTSGFSPGAVDRAEFGNIELRDMNELSPEQFGDWLTQNFQHLLNQHFEIKNVIFYSENPTDAIDNAIKNTLQASLAPFYLPFHNVNVSVQQLFDGLLAQNTYIGRDVPTEDNIYNFSVEAIYDNQDDPVVVNTALGSIRIIKLVFEIEMTTKVIVSPIWASEYKLHADAKSLGEVANAKYDNNGQDINVQMIKPSDGDGSSYIHVTVTPKK